MLNLGEGEVREYQEGLFFKSMEFSHKANFWKDNFGTDGTKSIGTIIHWLYVYLGLTIAERAIIGDSRVYYPSENDLLATYVWDDQLKMPIFNFNEKYENAGDKQSIYISHVNKLQDKENV